MYPSSTDPSVPPGRERRLPGVGSWWNKLPSASRPRGGGGAESAEDGQSDLRHPEGNDAGTWRTGDTDAAVKHIMHSSNRRKSRVMDGNIQLLNLCYLHLYFKM